MALPAQEELRRLYDYDPVRGTLVHKKTRGRAVAGASIGRGVNWKGYITARVHHKHYRIHRLIWVYHFGSIPAEMVVDHINRSRKDDRIENLRLATLKQNARNRRRSRNNTSGHSGVVWRASRRRWVVNIMLNGRKRRIGSYRDKHLAIERRKTAERALDYFPQEKATTGAVAVGEDGLAA
jgi:HNH endonuclease